MVLYRFILPILAEFSDSGYREPYDKFLYSLRENAKFHAMVLGASLLGLVYIFVTYGVSLMSLKGSIMALAYCWGLAFAIYLMGHGLVSIPRQLFRKASIAGSLRRLQSHAPALFEKMEDSLLHLEDVEAQVTELARRKTGSARDFSEWIEELVDIANLPESQPASGEAPARGVHTRLPTVITEKYMADLTRQLVRARHARSRYVNEWNRLVEEAAETQAVLDSAASKKLDIGDASPHGSIWDRVTIFTPYTRYLFYYHFVPYFRIFCGAALTAASACIVWSEMVKAMLPKLSIIRLTVVHHWVGDKGQVGFAGQVVSAFWILYMCAAALTSMTEVKVWRGRALTRRNTAYESAFWYSLQVAKLSVPLSYNFMTFLLPSVYKKTIFYDFLGQLIDLTPLGRWFDYLFPMFILFPVFATLFGLYGKVKRFLGFGIDIIEDEDDANPTGYATGSWREGRDLIERELNGTAVSRRRQEAASRVGTAGNPGGRATPILSIPAARSGVAGSSNSPIRSPARHPLPDARRQAAASSSRREAWDEPEGDENFFQILGHRMKNSIDTFEGPKWFQEIGEGIKKPKWMGGDDDEEPGSSSGPSDFRRWFGGGDSSNGRIRL